MADNRKYWYPPAMVFEDFVPGSDPEDCFPLSNPLNPSIVQDLICKTEQYSLEQEYRQLYIMQCSSWQPFKNKYLLPLDIVLNILDHIQDTSTLPILDALGWRGPDSYWQGRLNLYLLYDLVVELPFLKPREDFDWAFLCIQTESLIEESFHLRNRKRILQIAESIKSLIQENETMSLGS